MASPAMLIVALVVAIAIILFCIIVLKLNAAIGMEIKGCLPCLDTNIPRRQILR